MICETCTGTQAAPYCSIQAAADAVTAGDTVMIGGGQQNYYKQSLTISHSGTATAPITFEPARGRYFDVYGGKVDFKNSSTGTTQLVVDLEGCYSATLGAAFVPVAPYRALDTRSGLGQESVAGIPAPANGDVTWWDNDEAFGGLTGMTGAVMNITAVQSQANGVLTAYPTGGTVPTASNVNYFVDHTSANLAMVAADPYGISIHNSSTGRVQVIVDVFGYFS